MDAAHAVRFGTLLRRYRIAAGLTQEELAERAGISRRSLGDMERGVEHIPRRDTVALLADALALTAEESRVFTVVARRPGKGALAMPRPPVSRRRRSWGARASWPCWSAT